MLLPPKKRRRATPPPPPLRVDAWAPGLGAVTSPKSRSRQESRPGPGVHRDPGLGLGAAAAAPRPEVHPRAPAPAPFVVPRSSSVVPVIIRDPSTSKTQDSFTVRTRRRRCTPAERLVPPRPRIAHLPHYLVGDRPFILGNVEPYKRFLELAETKLLPDHDPHHVVFQVCVCLQTWISASGSPAGCLLDRRFHA